MAAPTPPRISTSLTDTTLQGHEAMDTTQSSNQILHGSVDRHQKQAREDAELPDFVGCPAQDIAASLLLRRQSPLASYTERRAQMYGAGAAYDT